MTPKDIELKQGRNLIVVHTRTELFTSNTKATAEYSKTGIETGLLQLQFENPAFSYSGFYFDFDKQY